MLVLMRRRTTLRIPTKLQQPRALSIPSYSIMFSRAIRRSILDSKLSSSALPPSVLPARARYLSNTAQHVESPVQGLGEPALSLNSVQSTQNNTSIPPPQKRSVPLAPAPTTKPLSLDPSVKEMLPLLATQPSHYLSIHIHGKPYLVTAGDIVRLPFQMPGVIPGDVLRLNRAASLGSRDFTLKGTPYIDERVFECRARVMGTEAEPMRTKEKKKRRNRRIHTVKSKHRYTILRIAEIKINSLESFEMSA
jgi:large subunit ribosomal protein L21